MGSKTRKQDHWDPALVTQALGFQVKTPECGPGQCKPSQGVNPGTEPQSSGSLPTAFSTAEKITHQNGGQWMGWSQGSVLEKTTQSLSTQQLK